VQVATLTDGRARVVAARRQGQWWPVAAGGGGTGGGAGGAGERATVLAALAGPGLAVASERPLPEGFEPAMPFWPPRDIFCLGKNYRAHAEEFARYSGEAEAVPPAPIVFTKSAAALCGPADDLVVAAELGRALDYEAELVVVIGRGGHDIAPSDAPAHVAGYSVLNDTTARDLQKLHAQWYLGKSLPAATPWGPVVVTPDELGDLAQLEISATVNGEQRQYARLGQMIFSVADAIACISRVVALVPGDLVAMGTPVGVGIGFDPPRYLGDGDVVACRVEGIGELRNRVRIPAPAVLGGERG
jgi:2-keto-4-pentenoate hydratase/2-oxohepta-3-ene-1,7-dioic acid hydratase in catechol pathway